VRRIVLIALSVMLALVMAMPIASGKPGTAEQKPTPPGQLKKNLPDLTVQWWNWASQDPSPLEGSYTGGTQCEGEYVEGVFFLAGSVASDPVERTCTVPARTPILFPISNVICSEAWPTDPPPYDECATHYTNETVDPPSTWYATLDGKDLKRQRVASGLFQWTIESNNPFGLEAGTYEAGSDGLWVYLKHGLKPGEHTIVFGGTYADTPFGSFEGARVTYHLTAE
jgi:hypothetical protein